MALFDFYEDPVQTGADGFIANPGDLASPDSIFAQYQQYKKRHAEKKPAENQLASDPSSWVSEAAADPRRSVEFASRMENPDAPGAWALQTFDLDPLGEQAELLARRSGKPADSSRVGGLVVAGKYMTDEELNRTPEGKRLLDLATLRRAGYKEGFWDRFTDLGVSDIPFFGMFAEVGGSYSKAKQVSELFTRVNRGEPITDDERILLGLYSMERGSGKTVGGMIGDIVRQAPGFMFEFVALGGGYSAARTGLAKTLAKETAPKGVEWATTLAVNRGTKIMAGELAAEAVKEQAVKIAGAGVARSVMAETIRGFDAAAKKEIADRVSTSIYKFVAETMGKTVPKDAGAVAKALASLETVGPYSDAMIQKVADNLAMKAVNAAVARHGATTAFNEFMIGMGQGIRNHAARALLDWGTWGTETSTILNTGFTTVKSAVGDALGASLIEAPIAGAMMYLPKRLVAQPIISAAAGGVVSENKLALQASATRTGDARLMEISGAMAEGMDLLEYVSENAGRGFMAGVRAAGLATGIARPAERAFIGTAGGILRPNAAVEAGGLLRRTIRKALGESTEGMAARTADDQIRAFTKFFADKHMNVSDDVIRQMVRAKAVPEALRSVAGSDYRAFASSAVKALYGDQVAQKSYKAFFRYWLADMMARNNWGPDQTLNFLQRAGYHGILGEMYEERYIDFAKGLFGLDDKHQLFQFHKNLGTAFRNLYPEEGWKQYVAEAVGFAVPAVTRSAVLNVQRVLNGSSQVDRARAAGHNYKDMSVGMAVYEDTLGTFDEEMKAREVRLGEAVDAAKAELEKQRRMLIDEQHIPASDTEALANLTKEQAAAVANAEEALRQHREYVDNTYAANSIPKEGREQAIRDQAGKLLRFGVLPRDMDRFTGKLVKYYSSEQLRAAMEAQDALLAEAGFLGKAYDDARQYGTGEQDISTWRKIAAKTIGIAGAVICGEPALAQLNSIKWAAVDEGLDPYLADDLGNLHKELRDKAVQELRSARPLQDPTADEIEAKIAEYGYEEGAKAIVRSRLLLDGVRMFAHSEMLDLATRRVAADQGYYYDRETALYKKNGSPDVSAAEFYRSNKTAVDELRDDIGVEVLKLLTADNAHLYSSPGAYLSFLQLPPGDSSTNHVARALAMQMAGFGKVLIERSLVRGVSVDTLLDHDSVGISGELVAEIGRYLKEDPTGATVPAGLIEQVAIEMQYPAGDMTDETLAKRRADILATVRVAHQVLVGEVKAYQRHVDIGASRLYDDNTVTIVFTYDPVSKTWSTSDDVRDGSGESKIATWKGDDAALEKLVADNHLTPVDRGVKFTTAHALTTSDPILLLQKLGLAKRLLDKTRRRNGDKYDYSRVHPALRMNDETQSPMLDTDAKVADALRREVFMAEYARTHDNPSDYNFEKAEWTEEVQEACVKRRAAFKEMEKNVLGDSGYMTTLRKELEAAGAQGVGTESLVRAALGRPGADLYSIGLTTYGARHTSANYFVPVNYMNNVDPVSSMVACAVDDGYVRYGLRFFRGNGVLWDQVRSYFRELDDLAVRHMFDPKLSAPARDALEKLHKSVTSNFNAPSRRGVVTVATAVSCGQTARAAARGHAATAYDAGFAAIMDEAKSLPSYGAFTSIVDLLLGGTGFENLQAFRAAGADAEKAARNTGLLRILALTGEPGAPLNDLTEGMKPAGMGWAEFEQRLNAYSAQHFKEMPKPKPGAEKSAPSSAFEKLRGLYAAANFESFEDVARFLVQLGRLEPFTGDPAASARFRQSIVSVSGQITALSTRMNELKAERDRLQAELDAKRNAGDVDGADDANERLQEILTEMGITGDLQRKAIDYLSTLKATEEGGDSKEPLPAKPAEPAAPSGPSEEEDELFGPRADVDVVNPWVGHDAPVSIEVGPDGTVTVRDELDESDRMDVAQKETLILSVVSAFYARYGRGTAMSEGQFKRMLALFTDNAFPPALAREVWYYYDETRRAASAEAGAAAMETEFAKRLQDLDAGVDDGAEDDGEEDGAQSANALYGAKYAKAFSNKQLDRFLSFYRYVSPQNGREFQAGVNGIRDNIVDMLARLSDAEERLRKTGADPASDADLVRIGKALRMLDRLFNSETVDDEGVEGHSDREALFTDTVRELDSTAEGASMLDDVISVMLEPGDDGRPRCRQIAYFLSYLRGMNPGARRRFLSLACCSVSTKKISMQKVQVGSSSTYDLARSTGRFLSVSSFSAVGSFLGVIRSAPTSENPEGSLRTAKEIRKIIDGIKARLQERDGERMKYSFSSLHLSENLRTVADVLAPAIGHEAPILQAITSPHLLTSLLRGYGTTVLTKGDAYFGKSTAFKYLDLGSQVPAPGSADADLYGTTPPMVQSVINVLDAYASYVQSDQTSDEQARRRKLADIVTVEFAMGIGTSSALEANKDMSVNTPWAWALGAYSMGLPETVATANTLPDRNSKIASKVAVSLQDAPPVIRQFLDKKIDDKTGFAYHAFNVWMMNTAADGGAALKKSRPDMTDAQLKDHFLKKVLPRCRQRLVWPNRTQSELLAKCIDRDYNAEERREACMYNFANGFLSSAMKPQKTAEGKAIPASYSRHWFVPIYNGDHSAGVIMQLPVDVLFAMHGTAQAIRDAKEDGKKAVSNEAAYKYYADMVNTWLGLDAFGKDSKRSSLACSEFPGRSMRAVRYRNGKLEKGETRIHVVHNYAMEGHNDALLGTTLATGYGLRVQQEVAKDMDTLTHKLHVMSGTGTDLTMLKSLITSMWEDSGDVRGRFTPGLAVQVLMDYIIDFRKRLGDADISTSMVVDEDSLKVGVMNSKTMGHAENGKSVPLAKYVFSCLKSVDVAGTLKGEALDRALCDNRSGPGGAPMADMDGKYRFSWLQPDGTTVRKTIGELLGGEGEDAIQVNVIDGLSGKTLDFSYQDNTLMSYCVANVSHEAKASVGKMPRNNAIDGMVMQLGMHQMGIRDDDGSMKAAVDSMATYGLLASVVGTDAENLEYARRTGTSAYKVQIGADMYGSEVTEQATRDLYKNLGNSMKPPLSFVYAPLLACGAVYDDGREPGNKVVDHMAGVNRFMNRLHAGSQVFTAEQARLYKTDRSLGFAHINMALVDEKGRGTGFRYGLFVNEEKLDEVYKALFGLDAAATLLQVDAHLAANPLFAGERLPDEMRPIMMLEAMISRVVELSRAYSDKRAAVDAAWRRNATDEEKAAAKAERKASAEAMRTAKTTLATLFRDHLGQQLSDYGVPYICSICFDDLFIRRNDGTRGFDRSAVVLDMPVTGTLNDSAAGTGVWLAGTTIGLPRTPSYNGSMWSQTLRASTWCTEITEDHVGADKSVIKHWRAPGKDAMVMPDPQTLKILGCDHDGDKSACYMYKSDPLTGLAYVPDVRSYTPEFLLRDNGRPDLAASASVFDFIHNPVLRRAYLDRMEAAGYVIRGRTEYDAEAGTSVRHGPEVTDRLRTGVANAIVRGYFDMSRAVPVDPGANVRDFYGTPMARPTRAHPLEIIASQDDPRWEELKQKSLAAFNFLAKSKIADSRTGARVSSSAQNADHARAMVVSWAGVLHVAYLTGLFNKSIFRFSGTARERYLKWVGFMYGADGVSNATFDDIKEQVCQRLGWTSGMMDTFFADLLFSADADGRLTEPPTTSDGFFKLLDDYITSVANGSSRFWMMVTSEPADSMYPVEAEWLKKPDGDYLSTREIKSRVKQMFGGRIDRSAVMAKLGIKLDTFGRGFAFVPETVEHSGIRMFMTQYVDEAGKVGLDASVALSRIVSDIARRSGVNAASGYFYWIASQTEKILSERKPGEGLTDAQRAEFEKLARDYVRWSNGINKLDEAREFAKAINYLKADPGSGRMMGARNRMEKTFREMMESQYGEGKTPAEDMDPWLMATMFAANMCAYEVEGAETLQGRMTFAQSVRDDALGWWARSAGTSSGAIRGAVLQLIAERAVNPNSLLQLEGNLTTIPFFLSALLTTPKARDAAHDLMYDGEGNKRIWDVLEKMAYAATSDDEGKNGAKDSTAGFQKAFVALFGSLYGLVSTSSSSTEFAALADFMSRSAHLSSVTTLSGAPAKGKSYLHGGADVEQIVCEYRDKDRASQIRVWDATDKIRRGYMDGVERATTNPHSRTLAKSFVLSAENLRLFLEELGERGADGRLGKRVKLAIKVLEALGTKENPAQISPEALFNQFLPIYATSVARSSTPDPRSNSVLNTLRGKFQELSAMQAKLDSGVLERPFLPDGQVMARGYRLMDLVCGSDLAMPIYDANNQKVRVSDIKFLTDEDQAHLLDLVASRSVARAFGEEQQRKLAGILEKARGEEGQARVNPRNRHYVGFLEGGQLLRSIHEYAASVLANEQAPVAERERTPEPEEQEPQSPVARGEKSPAIQMLADRFSHVVGAAADVEYTGGNVFTIKFRDGLRGSAASMFAGAMLGKHFAAAALPTKFRTDAAIRVVVGPETASGPAGNRSVKLDLNSPSFAASFCNKLQMQDGRKVIEADDFLYKLTEAERAALVNAYAPGAAKNGIVDFALSAPAWSISSDGVAALCGEIHLGSAEDSRKAFHEYFHSMIGMFTTLGVFGEADLAVLRAKYGKAPKKSGMLFNEEAAADAFSRYVNQKFETADKEGESVKSVFAKFVDALKAILAAIKRFAFGFDYRPTNLEEDDNNILFQMVIHGYAAQSYSRLGEYKFKGGKAVRNETAFDGMTASQIADAVVLSQSVAEDAALEARRDATFSETPGEAADMARRMAYDPTAGHKDPMAGHKPASNLERNYMRALREALAKPRNRMNIREIAGLLDGLVATRSVGELVQPADVGDDLIPQLMLSVDVAVDEQRDADCVAVDYETYFDDEVSAGGNKLREYVTHPKFNAYLVSIYGRNILSEGDVAALSSIPHVHAEMRADGYQLFVGPPAAFAPYWDRLRDRHLLAHNAAFDATVTDKLVADGAAPPWLMDATWIDTMPVAIQEYNAMDVEERIRRGGYSYQWSGSRIKLSQAALVLLGERRDKTIRDTEMKGWLPSFETEEQRKFYDRVVEYAGQDAVNCYDIWRLGCANANEGTRRSWVEQVNQGRPLYQDWIAAREKQLNQEPEEPTSDDVEKLKEEEAEKVKENHPELPPGAAEPIGAGKAAAKIGERGDPVPGHQAPVAGHGGILRAACHAAERAAEDLDADDLAILSGDHVVRNVYEELSAALNARREVSRNLRARGEAAKKRVDAAVAQIKRLTGEDYGKKNVAAALMYLYDVGYFKDAVGRSFRRRNRSINLAAEAAAGDGLSRFAARNTTLAAITGAVLAASGRRLGSALQSAMAEISDLRAYATEYNHVGETVDHVLQQLTLVWNQADPTRVLENGREWADAVSEAAMQIFTGVVRGKYNPATREFGDYRPSSNKSELAERNRALYQFADADESDPGAPAIRQKVLKLAADALFATAAQVKFIREFGLAPGSIHHDAWMGKVSRDPLEFTELTKEFGIGVRAFATDAPLVERWNDPMFIAANLDDWYAGTIRETFGARPIRQLMLEESRKLRGHMSVMLRRVNWIAMKWGLNRLEGRKLLKYKRFQATHEMTNDFIQAASKDENGKTKWYEGFSNEKGRQGDVTDREMTVDMIRDATLVHQLALAMMNGDDKVITGIDDISFMPDDFRAVEDDMVNGRLIRRRTRMLTAEDLTPEALDRRYAKTQTIGDSREALRRSEFRAMTGLEMALYRLSHRQWHSSVTGLADNGVQAPAHNMALYSRFRDAALAAADRVFKKYEDADGNLPAGFDKALFNHEVLTILEAQGLVVATAEDDSKTDADGVPLRSKAVLCLRGADIEAMWDNSDAKQLLVEARTLSAPGSREYEAEVARRKSEFTARALVDELGGLLKEFKRHVRDMPWLTRGETRYLNRIDTMIPVYEGTGSFMYGALRLERDAKTEQKVRISRHEMTWQNMLDDLRVHNSTYEKLTDMQLKMIHDYFGTKEQGSALMSAFRAGRYAEGTGASLRTGLVVNPGDASGAPASMMTDICTQIYRKQLERRLLMLEGRKQADFETEDSIGRMIQQYEQASESGGAVRLASEGLNATQLYRLHGALPVNFTIGKALINVMRGVQNSLYFRSALTSMLFTPDADGDPLFLASPDKLRWSDGGIGDPVWAAAAKWWCDRLGLKYDITKSGVENARAAYEAVQSTGRGKSEKGTSAAFRTRAKRFATLGPDELEHDASITGFMAQVEDDDSGALNKWGSARGILSLNGSEALGYARHLFQSTRLPGGHAAWYQRLLSWSKSMSVSYSLFFPIATKWESPTAAVGALTTMMSNLNPEKVRDSKAWQKFLNLGKKQGWIDETFLGFADVIRMMDTNDPFLNDLVMWAESIGVSMTDRMVNPKEPDKGIVVNDLENTADVIGRLFGDKASKSFRETVDMVFLRQSEKAFTYALNATKLAVAAQVAMRLRHEARMQGKAFDPIRDMKGWAEYVDSEIGGVNPLRYAWAHPAMRRALGAMWFSWEWTRTAWEAAGGGILEDIFLGGHAASKAQRQYTPWRWLRMFGVIMVGLPFLLQITSKALAGLMSAVFGLPPDPDDDTDKWFTWENDSKIGFTAANITPLLRLVSKFDQAYAGGAIEKWKTGKAGPGWKTGAAAGAAYQALKGGNWAEVLMGGAVGGALGAAVPGLIPEYTGTDRFNSTRRGQYFVHGGKQGWEACRWFTDPVSQFFSKLSMPIQKLAETVLGFSPANPTIKIENRFSNALGMFRPFGMSGWENYGDAGALSLLAPVKMGSSKGLLQHKAAEIVEKWATNDRGGYSLGGTTYGPHARGLLADVYRDAKAAGITSFNQDVVAPAMQLVVGKLYQDLFNAMPQKPTDGLDAYNKRAVERAVRALHRVGKRYGDMLKSVTRKYGYGGPTDTASLWMKAGPEFQAYVRSILREADLRAYDMPYVPSPHDKAAWAKYKKRGVTLPNVDLDDDEEE